MSQQILPFITQHWILCTVFIALLALVALNEIISQKQSPKMLSTTSVVELINQEKATIIDIRAQDAFTAGHITNAIRISADDLQKFQPYQAKPIILVCTKGIQANTLATKLRKNGFINTMVLNGGMTAWQAAGLPMIKGKK